MDVFLEHPIDDLQTRCNATLPDGLEILECAQVEDSVPKLSADIKAARYQVAVDQSNLAPGRNPQWDDFVEKAGVAIDADSPVGRTPLGAIENDIRSRFQHKDADESEPSLLDIQIIEKDGELRIEYLSTMCQGKSLFPEMLGRYVGDSLGLETPMQVVRKALYVERAGAYHSPIAKGVVQNIL
jgi:hypothetical protein